MTIASALTALNTDIVNARTAITNKGGTVTSGGGSSQLATDIATIPTGGTPTLITKSITANGTYNASSDNADGYSSVTVNVSASKYGVSIDNILGDADANGVLQAPSGTFTFTLPSNITDVGGYGLRYVLASNDNLISANLSSLTTVSGEYALDNAFLACDSLTTINLSSLTTISGRYALNHICDSCDSLTTINLSSLTTISGDYGLAYGFTDCKNLTNVSFPALTTISNTSACQRIFDGCTNLISVSFPVLATISANSIFSSGFTSCSKLTDVYFPALTTSSFGSKTNQFSSMLTLTSNKVTHTLHFPSNLQSTISGLSGYPLFGGTSGYVTLSFDLPATS